MENNEILWADKLSCTDLEHIESKICSNHCNISNMMNKKILFIEEKKPNHCNSTCFKSKCHGDNVIDNNYNIGKKLGNKYL